MENVRKISKTLLPQVNIKKIFINQGNIVVNGILTSQDQSDTPFWMDEKYFTEHIDVFFVVDHLGGDLSRHLSDPRSRVSNYSQYSNTSLEDWDFTLRHNYDHKVLSLKEMTDQESSILVTDSSIQSSSVAEAGSLKDIAFSIQIDLQKLIVTGDRVSPNVKIYAFTHLNFKGLTENYNLNTAQQSFIKMQQIGGNFVSETVLIRDQDENANEVYRVPQTTSMLVYNDGTPFHGAYHYHGVDNRGPEDYIGWMEGPATPMHSDARLLREVQIPYTKVVANFLFDDAGFRGIGFDGSIEVKPEVRPGYTYSEESIRQRALEEFYRTDRRSSTLRGRPIVFGAEHYVDIDENSKVVCSTNFSIDFEELIKTKSRYPFFYDRFKLWYDSTDRQLQEATKVQVFRITRYRLSNSTRSNNILGSADYERNSPEDIEEVVIDTSQPLDSNFVFPHSPGGFRDGINIISRDPGPETLASWYQRSYTLRDHDLSKKNFGNYAYSLHLQLDDLMKALFVEKVEEFRNYVENTLCTFLGLASMSRKEYDSSTGRYSRYVDGYDFNQNKYTDNFKNFSAANFDSGLEEMIGAFIRLQGLLGLYGNAPGDASASAVDSLVSQIIPSQGGDLIAALNFSKNCDHIIGVFDEILSKDGTFSPLAGADANSRVLGQRNSPDKALKNIDFQSRIPGHNQAYNVGDVFVEYNLNSIISQAGTLAAAPGRFRYISDTEDTVELLNVNDWLNLPPEAALRYAANLENILRTPSELTSGQALGMSSDGPVSLPTFGVPGLAFQFDGPGQNNLAADVNLNTGTFQSKDKKTPLGKVGNAAVLNSTKQISSNERYSKDKKNNQKTMSDFYGSKIFSSLSGKLAKGASKKTGQEGKDLISSKTKRILVREGNSSIASYTPISLEKVKSLGEGSRIIMVKVDDKVGKSEGSYRVSGAPIRMTVSQLSEMLQNTDQEDTTQSSTSPVQTSINTILSNSNSGRSY
jgi:hypothetical protein